ncbi:unnamed protein product [marine sediment metagenome]|uniref:Holin of 3TMs, for gene-transfer release n=1 Tax=marine sediment metagenome TaxID=412755 RepID=X1CK49_9ZZZZ
MDWKDVGKKLFILGAPILGMALGGPLGGIAAKAAVGMISKKLGIAKETVTPEIINDAITNPASLLKLREIEIEGKIELQRLLNEENEQFLKDVQNARNREVEITKITGKRDINLYILAWCVVIGFFAMTGMMYFKPIPTESIGPINQLFGALAAGFGLVLGYFFGSSKSSKEKTELLVKP